MSFTNSLANILINSSTFYLNAVTKFFIKTDNVLIINPIFIGDNGELQQAIQKAFESLLDLVEDKYNYYKFNSRFLFGSLSQYQGIFARFVTYQNDIRDYLIEQSLWDEYISALTRPSKIGVILCALIKNAKAFLDSQKLKIETEVNVKVLNETGDDSIDLLFKDENNQDTPVKISDIKLFDF